MTTRSATEVPAAWVPLVVGYGKHLVESLDLAPTTVATTLRRLRVLAAAYPDGPWKLDTGEVQRWVCQASTPNAMRQRESVARSFFSWAAGSGVIAANPAPSRRTSPPAPRTRCLPASSPWSNWLVAYQAWMTTRGQADLVGRYAARVRRMAADLAPTEPTEVSSDQITRWLDGLACGPEARRSNAATIRGFYTWALADGRVDRNPAPQRSLRRGPGRPPCPPGWDPWLDAWTTHLRAAGYPETTISTRLGHVRRMARALAPSAPDEVSSDDLVNWLATRDIETETRRSYRASARQLYGWALDTGRVSSNPATRLPRIRATAPNPRPASERAYADALAAASERESLMLRLAAEVGMRRGEVARVHSADLIDEDEGWSLLVHGKGRRDRVIPLPDGLASALRCLGPGWAFPGDDHGHLSPERVGKLVATLLPDGVGMHALRHRFATRAYDLNRDVFTVQQLLGHASPDTTRRYVKTSRATMRHHIDALGMGDRAR